MYNEHHMMCDTSCSIPNLLGRGGFGEVYKAKHQGKVCTSY